MKLLLEIQENQAPFVIELLSKFSFVKVQPFTNEKERILLGLDQAVEQVNEAKAGRIKLKSALQLLNEL